jgi:GNAT superfamily N-acetyltransferase
LSKITITKASTGAVQEVAPLFDAYRQFYGNHAGLEGARDFLAERLAKDESVIFLASEGGHAVGFAQLYPSFSSLSMSPTWILNDLFVLPAARGNGVGTALLEQCKILATETGAKELSLETMKTNLTAQRLYEACGWKRDELFYKYYMTL